MKTSSTPKVVFIGGGGHAAVCLDVFRSRNREVIGYFPPHRGELDAPYLGVDDESSTLSTADVMVFVAIGDNRLRMHPMASVSGGVVVGRGAFLGVGVSAIPQCVIGEWAMVGAGAAVIGAIYPNMTYAGVPARPRPR